MVSRARPAYVPGMRAAALLACVLLAVAGCGAPGRDAAPKAPAAQRAASPSPAPEGLVEGDVTSADGVSIHYRARAGRASRADVLLVHCWTCTSANWDHTMAHLAGRYRVVALDLAGHGKSGRDRQRWTTEAFGADVRAVAEALSLHDLILVGHSMGGGVMIEAARAMPDRVRALVAIDTLSALQKKPDPAFVASMVAKLEADFPGTVEPLARGLFAKGTDPAVVARVVAEMRAADPKAAIPMFRAMFEYDAGARMAAVKAPLRAIESDMHPTDVEGNRTIAPGFDAVIMKGVGHWPMLEAPDAFDDALETTLDALTK